MNDPAKPSAVVPATPSPEPEAMANAPGATATPADAAATLEQIRALLGRLDPADARRALEALSGARAARPTVARSEDDLDDEDDDAELEDLDENDEDVEGLDDEEEEDDVAAAPDDEPPLAPMTRAATTPRRGKPRLVAGMFEVSARVESCRLRTVNEMGERGEPVGHLNEQGIEQTEWPLGMMTAERLRRLTRGRGGKYLFEWLGRNALGKRVGLGRSQEFRMQGDRTRKPRPSGDEAAPRAPAPNGFEQFFAMQQ